MEKTALEARIALLKTRGMHNDRIVRKLQRRLRNLERSNKNAN